MSAGVIAWGSRRSARTPTTRGGVPAGAGAGAGHAARGSAEPQLWSRRGGRRGSCRDAATPAPGRVLEEPAETEGGRRSPRLGEGGGGAARQPARGSSEYRAAARGDRLGVQPRPAAQAARRVGRVSADRAIRGCGSRSESTAEPPTRRRAVTRFEPRDPGIGAGGSEVRAERSKFGVLRGLIGLVQRSRGNQ